MVILVTFADLDENKVSNESKFSEVVILVTFADLDENKVSYDNKLSDEVILVTFADLDETKVSHEDAFSVCGQPPVHVLCPLGYTSVDR